MLGLMQDWPLLMHKVLDHAAIQHPGREIISRSVEGPFHHSNYRDVRRRALRAALADALDAAEPDAVALAWFATWIAQARRLGLSLPSPV